MWHIYFICIHQHTIIKPDFAGLRRTDCSKPYLAIFNHILTKHIVLRCPERVQYSTISLLLLPWIQELLCINLLIKDLSLDNSLHSGFNPAKHLMHLRSLNTKMVSTKYDNLWLWSSIVSLNLAGLQPENSIPCKNRLQERIIIMKISRINVILSFTKFL